MKIVLVAVGQRMPEWVNAGYADYARRMPRAAQVRLIEIRAEARSAKDAPGAPTVERYTEPEAQRIRAALPKDCLKIVLDQAGRSATTRELAEHLAAWRLAGRDVAFVIGGPDGVAESLKREADWVWSLSPLTLPHSLVRVVLAEQLYRAASILGNHPYHRE
jgi:23S rRNA (pseudouridine1915-N3)-methyltransferase